MKFYTSVFCCLLAASVASCKKDKQAAASTTAPETLLIGTWNTQSVTFTAYNATTGAKKDGYGYDVEKPTSITFDDKGNFSTKGGSNNHGSYAYNTSRQQLVFKDSNGQTDTAAVSVLTAQQLKFTGSYISDNTKLVIEQSYAK